MFKNTTSSVINKDLLIQLVFVFLFFLITPVVIFASLLSIISLNKSNKPFKSQQNNQVSLFQVPKSGVRVFASLPTSFPSISGYAEPIDARSELIRKYLNFYNSPLEKYSEILIKNADLFSLDYRLLTAIAQKESNLCKIIPDNTFNCWGWGIHSNGTLGFDSYEQGIYLVSKGLKEEYLEKGYLTIDEIMSKYTPLSNGSWSEDVKKFMLEIEEGTYF